MLIFVILEPWGVDGKRWAIPHWALLELRLLSCRDSCPRHWKLLVPQGLPWMSLCSTWLQIVVHMAHGGCRFISALLQYYAYVRVCSIGTDACDDLNFLQKSTKHYSTPYQIYRMEIPRVYEPTTTTMTVEDLGKISATAIHCHIIFFQAADRTEN